MKLQSSDPLPTQLREFKNQLDFLSECSAFGTRMAVLKFVVGAVAAFASGQHVHTAMYEKTMLINNLDRARGLTDPELDVLRSHVAHVAERVRGKTVVNSDSGYSTMKQYSSRLGHAFALLLVQSLADPEHAPSSREEFDSAIEPFLAAAGMSSAPPAIMRRALDIRGGNIDRVVNEVRQRQQKSTKRRMKAIANRLGLADLGGDEDDEEEEGGGGDGGKAEEGEEVEDKLFTDATAAADRSGGLEEDDEDDV